MDCHIAGDSIAYGLGQVMRECSVDARVSLQATAIVARVRDGAVVIVSAGSNAPRDPALAENLRAIRSRATGRVIWISPIDHVAARTVREVAAERGDAVVTFEANADRVHPRSYRAIAEKVRTLIRDKP